MRKFNPREREFLKLLEKISNDDLEFFSYFMQREYFIRSKNLALAVVPQRTTAILFIRKGNFDDLRLRKAEIRKFIEILSLIDYLKQNRLIDIIPVSPPPQISMHLMFEDFENPTQVSPTSDITLNSAGLHFKYPDLSKIYNSQNEIIFDSLSLEKHTYDLILSNLMGLLFVSEELKDYVKKGFRSTEDLRYKYGQIATWVSISIAMAFGILGIYDPFSKKEITEYKIDSQQFDTILLQMETTNEKVNGLIQKLQDHIKIDTSKQGK